MRCVCDILNAGFHLARDVSILHFVCAILGFVCKVKKKRQRFENVCKQLKKRIDFKM